MFIDRKGPIQNSILLRLGSQAIKCTPINELATLKIVCFTTPVDFEILHFCLPQQIYQLASFPGHSLPVEIDALHA